MSQSIPFEDRLVDFLHETFPDSREMPAGESKQAISRLHKKANAYGLLSAENIAIYAIIAYQLGEDFDTEFPAATEILNHPGYSQDQKAGHLQNWTQQLLETLASAPENHPSSNSSAHSPGDETPMPDYLAMQAESQPYEEMAHWLVQQLTDGALGAVISHFSPNFYQQLGQHTVETVFAEQMLPFFAGSTGLGNSRTVTHTHDSFGSKGFAFYLSRLGPDGEKPFVLYLVNENGRLVLANLVLNKTFADLH